IRDLCEISQNFILYTISEECVLLIRTEVFEWENRNAFLRNSRCRRNTGDCANFSPGWFKNPEIPAAEGEQTERCKREGENSLFRSLKERRHGRRTRFR